MQCEVDGCNREATTHKHGELCLLHYKRFIRNGTTELPKTVINKEKTCKYCDRKIGEKGGGARGMCNRHYQNWLRHGDPLYTDKIRKKLGSRGYEKRINGKDKHRIILEDNLGRQLDKCERVHHINLNKTDNRIENLFLCETQSKHSLLHRQLESLAGELVQTGIIGFKDGKYYICK